jgi:hypothetical protein
MAKFFTELTPEHRAFITAQRMFFVSSAPRDGRVNLSPKGLDTFRVLAPNRVGYLDATGSGNETAAHLAENGRATFMFCAFVGDPLILRLYTRGRAVRSRDAEWTQLRPLFGPPLPGERQLIVAEIETVQTSCGWGVPLFAYEGDRTFLPASPKKKGPAFTAAYWAEKNTRSIDGLPTGLLEP